MKESVILQSPHAVDPLKCLTEEEKDERYRTRLDESYRPYTVIDVLTSVYHRCFEDDLCNYAGEHPEEVIAPESGWGVSRVWVNECRICRVETLFFQPLSDFAVELLVHASLRAEIVRSGNANMKRYKNIRRDLHLRYSFDLRPCKLTCRFVKAVVVEEESLLALNPMALRADKYLLPLVQDSDYPRLAKWILARFDMPEEGPLDVNLLAERMEMKLLSGRFPENSVTGEIFFNYGRAEILDPATGKARDTNIDPYTVILNMSACRTRGLYNVTLLHECTHQLLAMKHFLLQMTHGHQFCSYLCKRRGKNERKQRGSLSPVDIMEIHANKLPGYLMIEERGGKARAEAFLQSYPDRGVVWMTRFVQDMAEYYGTTQTLAKTRLLDMGYSEVRGVLQSANGELIPAYLSDLEEGQKYDVDHSDALKEYVRNPAFREVLDSGRYIYCEGHFCLNDSRYIQLDHLGRSHLSAYARNCMKECCLVFEEDYEKVLRRLLNGVLQKGRGANKIVKYVARDGGSAVTAEGQKFREMIVREYQETAAVQPTFQEMLNKLMEMRKFSKGRLAEETGLSVDTIQRMKNEPERTQNIRSVVAICIAMHLPESISSQLIELSSAKFQRSEEMYAYKYVVKYCYQSKVSAVNRFLVEAGFEPLTGLVDGYDEQGVRM